MQKHPLTDNLPAYETVQRFLQIIVGTRYSTYVAMMNDIYAHIGNPKNPVNWKDPDSWISQRLTGESRELASRLWSESDHRVNPRHSYDMRALCGGHHLAVFSGDAIQLTDKGKRFINNDDAIIRAIDQQEGILFILSKIMEKGLCKRLDLIESFTTYCHGHTTWKAHSSIDSALSARFRHLRQRELIERSGHIYEATDAGLAYLRQVQINGSQIRSNLTIAELAKRTNDQAREELGDFLKKMNPYHFEHLIKRLLEEMGYDNVEVTGGSNDKGVDVVADIELGISHVREVIQVKRWKDNVGGPVLNHLRGSLPLFRAMRGSIITTAGFTKQAKDSAFVPGAAPITLIDGETLLDLLIKHDIGISRREIRVMEFDRDSLAQFESDDGQNAM